MGANQNKLDIPFIVRLADRNEIEEAIRIICIYLPFFGSHNLRSFLCDWTFFPFGYMAIRLMVCTTAHFWPGHIHRYQ